jgi:hypothetical protein
MRKLIWGVVGFGVLVWSGLALLLHNLVGWGGAFASRNADVITPNAEAVEWLSWLAMFGTDIGGWIIAIVWGLGVILALVLGFAGTKLVPKLSEVTSTRIGASHRNPF